MIFTRTERPRPVDGPPEPRDELVTIASFWIPMDAHIAKMKLDFADVASVLLDENMAMLRPAYAMACGGMRLQVRRSDLSRAIEALSEERRTINGGDDVAADTHVDLEVCPECGGESALAMAWDTRLLRFLLFFFFTIEPGFQRTKRYCKICGAIW